MKYVGVTYKHLRLFVKEENEGWYAYVYDLNQLRPVHEGSLSHPNIESAQKEAQTSADLALGETTEIDW
jgi:hypothetical protein